jgi:hypothetical protein
MYATDVISRSYDISITNPSDGNSVPSAVLVTSSTLNTNNPDDASVHAPPGTIYLSLQATSSAAPEPANDPNNWDSFTGMTPLPAGAIHFTAASGKTYPSVRADPVNTSQDSGDVYDGLVDATYYFVVPISTSAGSIVISRCRTIGYESQDDFFNAVAYQLNVGGPTKIEISFPRHLNVSSSTGSDTSSREGIYSPRKIVRSDTFFCSSGRIFSKAPEFRPHLPEQSGANSGRCGVRDAARPPA